MMFRLDYFLLSLRLLRLTGGKFGGGGGGYTPKPYGGNQSGYGGHQGGYGGNQGGVYAKPSGPGYGPGGF